jgi:hypothetical protein
MCVGDADSADTAVRGVAEVGGRGESGSGGVA